MPDFVFTSRGKAQVIADLEDVGRKEDEAVAKAKAHNRTQQQLARETSSIFRAISTEHEKLLQKIDTVQQSMKEGLVPKDLGEAAIGRLQSQLDELDAEPLEKIGQASETSGGMLNRAFGEGGVASNAISHLAGLFTAGALTSQVVKFFTAMEDSAQEAADAVKESVEGFGQLAQISDDVEEFSARVALARSLRNRGIFGPKDQTGATQASFDIGSANLAGDDLNTVLDLGERRLVSANQLGLIAKSIGTYQAGFGVRETGSARDIINKLLTAAGPTPADQAEMAKAASKLGPLAGFIGVTDEEALAALSQLAKVTGDASEAGTQVGDLFGALRKQGIKGPLTPTLQKFKERVDAGESAKDVLGVDDKQATLAFLQLSKDLSALNRSTEEIYRAQKEDPLAEKLTFLDSDPILSSANLAKKYKGRKAGIEEASNDSTERENLLDAYRDWLLGSMTKEGRHGASWVQAAAINTRDVFGGDDVILMEALLRDKAAGGGALTTEQRRVVGGTTRELPEDMRANLVDYFARHGPVFLEAMNQLIEESKKTNQKLDTGGITIGAN